MCRDNDHGGRRCPSDTSANRNLRRHNQNAISRNDNERTTKLVTADTTVTVPAPAPELTFEQKKEALVAEAKQHSEDAQKYMQPDEYNPVAAEVSTRKVGATLNSLSDLIAGRPYAEEVAEVQASLAEAKADEDRIYKELVELNRERSAAEHEVMEEKGRQAKEAGEWTEQDQEAFLTRLGAVKADFSQRVIAKNVEYRDAMKKVSSLASSEEAKEVKLRHRAALLEAISTVRELGGEVQYAENSDAKAAKAVQEAVSEVYPKDWIDSSNSSKPDSLRIKKTTSRAHYSSLRAQKEAKVLQAYQLSGWGDQVTEAQTPGTRLHALGAKVLQPGEVFTHPQEEGKTYSARYETEPVVVVPRVEWHYSGYGVPRPANDEDAPKPSGTGWKEAKVDEGAGKLVTRWYRPKKERIQTSVKYQAELTVSGFNGSKATSETRRVALHEFAHRVEASPIGKRLCILEEKFLERRTTGADGERERLSSIYPGGRGRAEMGYKDDFVHHYMGKVYRDQHREVMSMGVEAVFGDSQGSLMGWGGKDKGDQDMRNFIVGLWASA